MRGTIDGRGRIQLPTELRRAMRVRPGDAVELTMRRYRGEEHLSVVAARPRCCVCGAQGVPLAESGAGSICVECADAIMGRPLVFSS